jgi:hypothetical protein
MGKKQLLSLSALSPQVTAEFSSGVDLPITVSGSGEGFVADENDKPLSVVVFILKSQSCLRAILAI